ncbi:hypothetical protein [Euzebya pacifica]|uniref:hypothetical protein n=1 Tax=Euzebya pacifica TaxID=1608957 RepID=UPI001C1F29BA|nr:hypothetical protein [Euzebya pacifica]
MTDNDHMDTPYGTMPDQSGSDAPSRSRVRTAVFIVLALVVGLGAGLALAGVFGSGGDQDADTPVTTSSTSRDGDPEAAAELPAPDAGIAPDDATDPEQALRGFLAAEASGDWETSYAFLTESVQNTLYPSVALWVNAHADFPRITGYRVDNVDDDGSGTARIDTLTGFEPMIDPVIGLVAARGRSTWTLQEEDGLWRVETTATENRALYPSQDGADAAARQWVDARVDCADTAALEARLVGAPVLASQLCEEDQPDLVELGAVRSLADADGTTALLSEYGPDVYAWARVVPVQSTTPFLLVLGPVGEEWQVVGVLPRT